ncbi:Predicted nuclease (RNAse H fold) [Mycobacterium numidiamassiliense]|uniref:Predicted nuclease (RNAse H fold) n=2 Tax=Mycobacterium numidiamassiliense TaxID=1841861 RepID=A0A2U3PIL2_9MYCO|nr:Predicted nuclease (RNAse H fold) [Mycobacterium numidiamassiliense]
MVESNDYDAITVDIPLGLLDNGFRKADIESKIALGPRRSSVFLTPPRSILQQDSYDSANALSRELTGLGLSKQSYALRQKVLEADKLFDDGATLPLFEIHPEVSFMAMGDGPALMSKKTWHGQRDRMTRLGAQGIVIPAEIGVAAEASPDDILDAAAAAWSADRIATGCCGSIPSPPQINERRQRVAIWY